LHSDRLLNRIFRLPDPAQIDLSWDLNIKVDQEEEKPADHPGMICVRSRRV
jgi:hypothetical protein